MLNSLFLKISYAWCRVFFQIHHDVSRLVTLKNCSFLLQPNKKTYNSFATCIKLSYCLPFCFVMHTCINIVSKMSLGKVSKQNVCQYSTHELAQCITSL